MKTFHDNVSDHVSAEIKMGSGPEAAAFLSHGGSTAPMSDEHMRTAVRHRLGAALPAGGTGVCQHKRVNKVICGKTHGPDCGDHALICKVGGGVDWRHNCVRDALHGWMVDNGVPALTEQEVPKFNTPDRKAGLDIAYTDRRLGPMTADVSLIRSSLEGGAKRCLKALERREKSKHVRYSGPGLFAFVLDVRGRWGREAYAMVQSVVSHLDPSLRAAAIKDCRRRVSRALHFATAEQLMSAAGSQQTQSLQGG